jgi:hypothetical protein
MAPVETAPLLSPELSSPLQPPDAATPTISSASVFTSMSTNPDVALQLPMAGPMIAAVLVCIVVVATAVVICFLQRQPQGSCGRRSFEAPFIFRSDSHSQRSGFLRDEIPSENQRRIKKYRRYSRRSRHPGGTVEVDLSEDGNRPEGREIPLRLGNRLRLSTLALNVKEIHHIVDRSQTSATVPLTASSNQAEQCSLLQPSIELPLLSPSQNDSIHDPPKHISPASLPQIERQRLNTLIQQRAVLLASGNTSDKSVNGELILLEEQIKSLRHQDLALPQPDTPPPYDPER